MAESEEPQFSSLKDRINALNQQKSAQATTTTFGKRAPPPLPPAKSSSTSITTTTRPIPPQNRPTPPSRPSLPSRTQTVNNPPLSSIGSAVDKQPANLPAAKTILSPPSVDRGELPIPAGRSRTQTPVVRGTNPSLPSRQPSLPPRDDERRGSNASTVSLTRTKTGGSVSSVETGTGTGRKLPPVFGDAKLPPLPFLRREVEGDGGKVPLVSVKSAPAVPVRAGVGRRDISPALPQRDASPAVPRRDPSPAVPQRPQLPSRTSTAKVEEPVPTRKMAPVETSRSALNMGFHGNVPSTLRMGFGNKGHPVPKRQASQSSFNTPKSTSSSPPPIPLSSKPTQSAITEAQNRPPPPPRTDCLRCRDFSRPDQLASLHPRETLPRSNDYPGYLAQVLCSPFPSLTDKARAIFTWCHHNIAYDTYSFFNNCVKHQDPSDAITKGLAVCAGYAGAYAAIALKAGLECVVVNGDGKGFGYVPLKPGQAIPPYKSNHAWNAVRIDDGEWKLIDACWGAGHTSADQVYTKHFTPSKFTMTNEEFGLEHYPEDERYFFRDDGRVVSWEEYAVGPLGRDAGEAVTIYSNPEEEHGIARASITPALKAITMSSHASDDVIRFQYSNICTHWNHVQHGKGKPYPMVLCIGGVDGRKQDYVGLQTNGYWWWCDVRVKDLGCRGGDVHLRAVNTVDGKDCRGMTAKGFRERGNVGCSFVGVACWKLV